jgi:hypothetical protein
MEVIAGEGVHAKLAEGDPRTLVNARNELQLYGSRNVRLACAHSIHDDE